MSQTMEQAAWHLAAHGLALLPGLDDVRGSIVRQEAGNFLLSPSPQDMQAHRDNQRRIHRRRGSSARAAALLSKRLDRPVDHLVELHGQIG